MALSQKHRSTIYQRLEPILGEEEAEALLAQFPAHDLEELVTRDLLHAEMLACGPRSVSSVPKCTNS